jgi:hypothetical protein
MLSLNIFELTHRHLRNTKADQFCCSSCWLYAKSSSLYSIFLQRLFAGRNDYHPLEDLFRFIQMFKSEGLVEPLKSYLHLQIVVTTF